MRFGKEQWQELWYTLKSNKRRSIVTSLGVFAGMFFLTVLTSLGNGLGNATAEQLKAISSNSVFFLPGRTTMPYQGYKANRKITLTYQDYLAIDARAKLLKSISCYTSMGEWGNTQVVANGRSRQTTVVGLNPNYYTSIEEHIAIYGRPMQRQEMEQGAMVCTVGDYLAEKFYPDSPADMVGTIVTLNGVAYKVVGVVKQYSDNFSFDFNARYCVEVPLSNVIGTDVNKEVYLAGNMLDGVTAKEAGKEVYQIIARRQNLNPQDEQSIIPMGMELFNKIFGMISKGINLLIWIVGMGTLITGVISVSNILLVTVRERQREIGVRRAIGAKPQDIRSQFMAEALLIILIAGSVGIFLGMLVSLLFGTITESTKIGQFVLRPYPDVQTLTISVIIMIVAGVLAGLLPVYKALEIKAIDAIRDE
ncbi:Macrolide export ATP-binding/permease protein MacB [Porphyromonas levii]|uniref:ABC transporter permease n=1 Tax=Porphyromonas levii TaxID=28114 RepID=UPI001BAA8309|nr:ABC transporter permease [Porphyromonas levii]MBR8763966.1 Macrolide export ATP-binding/permease protein MacB [Porphyromonas levii]